MPRWRGRSDGPCASRIGSSFHDQSEGAILASVTRGATRLRSRRVAQKARTESDRSLARLTERKVKKDSGMTEYYTDSTLEVIVHELGHSLQAQVLGYPADSLSVKRTATGGAVGFADAPTIFRASDQIQLQVVWGGLLAELEVFGEAGVDNTDSARTISDRDRLVVLIGRTGAVASLMAEQSARRICHQYRRELLGAARQILDMILRSEDGTVLLDAQSLAALLPARRFARV
jgi:hypothetical protein